MQIEYQHSSLQDGDLAKSMKQVAKKGDGAVATKNAITALAESQTADLKDIVSDLADSKNINLGGMEDVTTSFLETKKPTHPARPASKYFVYRGIVLSLTGRKMDERQKSVGIMAGANDIVIEVCIAENLQDALSCSELKTRWEKLEFDLVGLVAWDHENDPSKYTEQMAVLLSKQVEKPLLLLLIDSSGQMHSWEFKTSCDQDAFIAVDISSNKNKNRRKELDFKIYPLGQVGVTFEDTAKSAVIKAVSDHLGAALVASSSASSSSSKAALQVFKRVAVPADGFCFWHSILAGLNSDKFCAIRRHMIGCAVNSRQEQRESREAKKLAQTVAGSRDVDCLFPNGYVELPQIEMIGWNLNLAIRVSVSEEAGSGILSAPFVSPFVEFRCCETDKCVFCFLMYITNL